MKIGVIGIGDIAQKAYLPITTRLKGVELFVVSRNTQVLKEVKAEYKGIHIVPSVEELLTHNVDAVMIHSATVAHYEQCKLFLLQKIAVYVDKPVSLSITETKELFTIAKENNCLFRVGFNRRFAPTYRELKEEVEPNIILYQKNRSDCLGEPRSFVFDDFIHVVDSVLFLAGTNILDVSVHTSWIGNLLQSLHVNLLFESCSATLIMHRNTGSTDESLEVISKESKVRVDNLSERTEYTENGVFKRSKNNWEPTLHTRGFKDMVDMFIRDAKIGSYMSKDDSALITHEVCDTIYKKIMNQMK